MGLPLSGHRLHQHKHTCRQVRRAMHIEAAVGCIPALPCRHAHAQHGPVGWPNPGNCCCRRQPLGAGRVASPTGPPHTME
jgi:hypothetical protein